ncbi:hypothetical protein KSF_103710 [Reticulibacter mediterranei]|uniref:Uncharacterized protein n=1 Tax=Reticulibacter mediterranei TaxID=2778369 RepID=A0A8J3ITN6_9CHLR|nr:hypothetical protein KSF_103710 [Reticulibacter mediterranei]
MFLLGNIPGDAALLAMVQQSRTPCVAVVSGSQLPVPLAAVDEVQGTLLSLEGSVAKNYKLIKMMDT